VRERRGAIAAKSHAVRIFKSTFWAGLHVANLARLSVTTNRRLFPSSPTGGPPLPLSSFTALRSLSRPRVRLHLAPPPSPYLWRYLARVTEKPAPAASFAKC